MVFQCFLCFAVECAVPSERAIRFGSEMQSFVVLDKNQAVRYAFHAEIAERVAKVGVWRGCIRLGADAGENTWVSLYFFFQAEDGIRDLTVTGVQTCALPI